MGFLNYLSQQRNRYSTDLQNSEKYWSLSALLFHRFKSLKVTIPKYAHGKLLDAGAGALNIRSLLQSHCAQYVSLDISNARGQVDVVGDIQNMPQVDSSQ